ncbi:MAG: radical SAM protein [Lachnospiraceae bacterium]|nr:radical SAM protein [Lachnospiraceae bacterium]
MAFNVIEKRLIDNATQKNIPISGSIELLPLCNMDCNMCYVRLSRSEMEQQGRLRTPEEWINIGRQMLENSVLFVQITGGEPLLYRGFREVYLALKKFGIYVTLNTNGTLIDEVWADFFAHYKPRRINITLYGADSSVYRNLCHYEEGFDKTIRAIKLLRERGVDVKINGSLVKANRKDLTKLLAMAKDLDAPIHVDTYMYPATRERIKSYDWQCRLTPEEIAEADIEILKYDHTDEDFRSYVRAFLERAEHPEPVNESAGRMKCLAGRSSFFINWQGQMQPCVMLPLFGAAIGEGGFAEAWRKISDRVKNVRLSQTCAGCSKRDVCTTCAACALYESGSIDGTPDYMCRYTDQKIRRFQEELKNE